MTVLAQRIRIKKAIISAMDKYIPDKTIKSSKHSPPWIDHKIKRAIRKRNRLYKKSMSTKKNEDFEKYQMQKALTQSSIRKAHWTYIENTITTFDENNPNISIPKRVWSHIKTNNRDRTGTSPWAVS